MTDVDLPKRQPAETRQLLLDATRDTVLEKGLAGLTLDGVARTAGVSKGGLLHHFPSKQHLIDALVVDLHQQFRAHWQRTADSDPVAAGRHTRAYLHVATRERHDPTSKLCNIIAVEDRENRTLRSLWKEFLTSLLQSPEAGGVDPVMLAIVQLATDGLWLASIEGVFENAPELYNQVVDRLDQMTRFTGPFPFAPGSEPPASSEDDSR